ncbi:hypothetical protein IM40_01505 [Candidatus Paracaedimonas acanthamoebae]|nr:hypothetical protein IM40_01505 [Candidatus Paracaedimonas acanthamoebae]
MKLKILNLLIFIGSIHSANASTNKRLEEFDQAWARDIHSLSYKIQEITKIEVNNIKGRLVPSNSIVQRLKPILDGIQELGSETDPSVRVIMQAYRLFKCSLEAYYQPLTHELSPQLTDVYHRVTKENFGNDVEYMAQFLKITSQMVFYEPPENYAKFFGVNIAKNHAVFFTLCKERLPHLYPEYFTWQMVANDNHNVVKFLSALYKTHKSYGVEMQGYLKESWQAHRMALPKICPHHIGPLISSIKETDESIKAESLVEKNWKKNLITEDVRSRIKSLLDHPPQYFILDETPEFLKESIKILTFVNEPVKKDITTDISESPKPSLPPAKEVEGEIAASSTSSIIMVPTQEDTTLPEVNSVMDFLEFYTQLEPSQGLTFPASTATSEKARVGTRTRFKTAGANNKRKQKKEDRLIIPPLEKTSFTLRHTMAEEAIEDFLKALNVLSEATRKSLPERIKEDIKNLKSKQLSLKRAYKIMLRIINYAGVLELDRGKGSHALVTIFRDGKPKK